jgi:hypothetical protein
MTREQAIYLTACVIAGLAGAVALVYYERVA